MPTAARSARSTRAPFECEWHAGDRVTEHLFRIVATLKNGSQLVQNVRTRSLTVTETVDVDVIQVTAVVTDGGGRFIRGLTRDDFRIYDNGQLQQISDFAAENIPLELVSVIDVSSSMRDSIAVVKEAAKRFLTALAPADQVTVLAFNENIFTARAARDRSGGADPRGRSHGSVGRHGAVRRDHPEQSRFSDGSPEGARSSCSATATIRTAMRGSTAPFARPKAATQPSTRSGRDERWRRRRCRSCCARLPPSAAAARSSPTIRKRSMRYSPRFSRTSGTSILISYPAPDTSTKRRLAFDQGGRRGWEVQRTGA